MATGPNKHREPVMGLLIRPYEETCMSGESRRPVAGFVFYMTNKLSKTLLLSLVGLLFFPQIVLAAWWNPFSWRIFTRRTEPKIEKNVSESASPLSAGDQSAEIKDLRKEVEDLKKKNSTPTPKSTPKITILATPTPKVFKEASPTPVASTPSATPTPVPTPLPTPDQTEIYRQNLITQLNSLVQQRQQQLLAQQQEEQQYQQQLKSITAEINQIKAEYYAGVEAINKNPNLSEGLRVGSISRLATDSNFKINKLIAQYNLLLSQQGAPINYQISQNLTLPQTTTMWRIEGSLNGMGGIITGSNGQSYRWDCVNSTNCTIY